MIDIENLKVEIIKRLKPLNPDKIILFGSYAYGVPTEESDIDLFLVKDLPKDKIRGFRLEARKKLRDLIFEQHLGIDIVADSMERIKDRIQTVKDQFYEEIMTKGKVIYG
jgi:predicted nucleotidyltransferase